MLSTFFFFLRQDLSPCGSQASVCLCLTDAGITLTCHRSWLLCGGSGYGVPVFAKQASTLLNKMVPAWFGQWVYLGMRVSWKAYSECLVLVVRIAQGYSACLGYSRPWILPSVLKKKKQQQTNPCIVLLKISVLPSERKEGQEYCVCVWLRRRRHKGPEMFLFTHLLACYRFLDKPLC